MAAFVALEMHRDGMNDIEEEFDQARCFDHEAQAKELCKAMAVA
jgi:hypothetical protein